MKLNEFIPKDKEVQRLYCKQCDAAMILTFGRFDEDFAGIRIVIDGLPLLSCERCGIDYLPDRSRADVVGYHYEAWDQGKQIVDVKLIKMTDDFGFTRVHFIYDPRDYYYIPGLYVAHNTGFLTPVFFDKAVLIYFHHHPEYTVEFASKTYGYLHKGTEHGLCFGINKNGKVIMWLGDIAQLPDNVQYRLRADNIESDHDIGSEFYDGQIEAKFTESTPEDKLIKIRSKLSTAASQLFGRSLFQLDDVVLGLILDLKRPILFTEMENKHVIDILNKINIEALDASNLKELLIERNFRDTFGPLKNLEKLYETEFPEYPISSILQPLHALYNLRIAFLHLKSNRSKDIRKAIKLIGIDEHKIEFETIYTLLIEKLTQCYKNLYEVSTSRTHPK